MARRRRKKERLDRAKPPENRRDTTTKRPKTERFLKETAILSLGKMQTIIQRNKIRQQKVRPMLSLLSPHPCQAKKDRVRHEYFSMIKSGKGRGPGRRPGTKNRFTVIC